MDTTNPNIVAPNALQKKDQLVKNYIRSIAEIDAAIPIRKAVIVVLSPKAILDKVLWFCI